MDGDGSAIPLAQLRGCRIARGALDLRYRDVYSTDGRRIGAVDELLVDRASMQVRYLDVEVENLVATGRERHVLIPVHRACLDSRFRHAVVVEGLAARAVPRLPSYSRGAAVRGGDPVIARAVCEPEPSDTRIPLDLPIRVEPPLIIRPIRLPTTAPVPAPEPAARTDLPSREPAGAGAASRAA